MTLKLGSLFNGVSGWPLAAVHSGAVVPVWASEIDEYPTAVSKAHFPNMKQLGDITKINGADIEPVDIITSGSPCQSVSVAGNRTGFKGESGLFYEGMRIVNEMRKATNGKYPRFFVFENVPGLFTSNKGMDFKAVLEEIGATEVPMPDRGKWANAGLVQCDRCEIAWRVLDAQYWGVPQRRRRIFLVADFAPDNRCAGEILFKCEGVQGNSETCEGTRQGAAGATAESTGKTVCYARQSISEYKQSEHGAALMVRNHQAGAGGDETLCLTSTKGTQCNSPASVENCVGSSMFVKKNFTSYNETPVAGTLRSSGGDLGGGSENIVCNRAARRERL